VGRRAEDADLGVGEGRDVGGDRIFEQELALLRQRHRRDRGDRLRHREDAEDRVRGHWRLRRLVAEAEGLEIGDLAVPRDEQRRARDQPPCDFILEMRGDARQALARKPDLLRISFVETAIGMRHDRSSLCDELTTETPTY
jgi:hypothetical protein